MLQGIISGLICAILVYIFTSLFNISAKKEVRQCVKRLAIYIDAIDKNITWGTDDKKSEYYDYALECVHFCYLYLDNALQSIKPLNFMFRGRKYILHQLYEIQAGLDYILGCVEGTLPEQERLSRLNDFDVYFRDGSDNILVHRAEFVGYLLSGLSTQKAAEKASVIYADGNSYEIKGKLMCSK